MKSNHFLIILIYFLSTVINIEYSHYYVSELKVQSEFFVYENHTGYLKGEIAELYSHTGEKSDRCHICDICFNPNLCKYFYLISFKENLTLFNMDLYFINQFEVKIYNKSMNVENYQVKNTFNLSHYLYVGKCISRQPYEAVCYPTKKPCPRATVSILLMLMMCGDTGTLINPGPIDIDITGDCNINLDMNSNYLSCNENYLEKLDPDNNYFANNVSNFSTYNIDTFKSNGITKNGSLNIMHHNSRSILSEGRMDEYNILLNAINNPFHVIGFTETWLKKSNIDLVSFNGYSATHSVRNDNEISREIGGGLSLFVKENINFTVRNDLNLMSAYIETLFIEFFHEEKKYVVGLIYRVPNTSIKDFTEKLDELISPIRNSCELILMGDFNICLLQDNNHTTRFCNNMLTHNLFPTILQPTREATVLRNGSYVTTRTLIDNIFINTQQLYQSGLIYSCISDHYPVYISLTTANLVQHNEQNIIRYRVIDDPSIRKFRFAINNTIKNTVMEINDAPTAFTEFFMQLNVFL